MSHKLIASDRVEGTAVYDRSGKNIGTIERVMIDKISGKIAYAVLTFGGFLGFGEKHFPTPWDALKYNVDRGPGGGYEVEIAENQLKDAPSYEPGEDFDWGDRSDDIRTRFPIHSGWI
jgi:sporulation protein YlmC with PRC-barrel domain